MKSILSLVFCTLFTYSSFAAIDGRAIRSNWDCMSSAFECVGTTNGSLEFDIKLRFQPNQTSLPPCFLNAEVNGQPYEIPISIADINNGQVINSLIAYDANGNEVYGDVVDLRFPLSFEMELGTSVTYSFSLTTTNNAPFPIQNHTDLMSMLNPYPGMTSFVIDHLDQIVEDGTKQTCHRNCDENLTVVRPMARQNTTLSSLSSPVVTPNPFDHSVTVNYETLSPGNSTLIELIDIQGKTVQQFISNDGSVGNHAVGLNTEELSAGMYLCRISNSEGVKTVKLLKQVE